VAQVIAGCLDPREESTQDMVWEEKVWERRFHSWSCNWLATNCAYQQKM